MNMRRKLTYFEKEAAWMGAFIVIVVDTFFETLKTDGFRFWANVTLFPLFVYMVWVHYNNVTDMGSADDEECLL